jgi:hypothetical protein
MGNSSRSRHFVDDSWAVWIDGDDVSSVYFNDWLNPSKKSFIDVSVHIRGLCETKGLNIFIPFDVEKDEIEDISLHFSDQDVLRATFGTMCIVDYMKNECTSEIAYNGKTIDIIHLSKLPYTLTSLTGGTLLRLDFAYLLPYMNTDEGYLMIRVPHKSMDELFKPSTDVIGVIKRLRQLITTPVVSNSYGYQVRINEARLLPMEINKIGIFHRQMLKKATITISIADDYEINDANCYRIRRLEKELYENFAPAGFDCDDVINYQWNQNREVNLRGHFNFYFNLFTSKISSKSMAVYMLLIVVLGACGSGLCEIVSRIIKAFFG